MILLIFLLIMPFSLMAKDEHAIHPVPKEPKIISSSLLNSLRKNIQSPPRPGSDAQKQDEKELKDFQKNRTSAQCDRARSEVYVSLASFYGKSYGFLSKEETDRLAPFFEQIRNDADYYIQIFKKEFPRQRPFLYIEGLEPCVPKEVTGAYPSGHATLARLYALILKEMFPNKEQVIDTRTEEIANDRVLSGMHHPSDIRAGKELADELYKEFLKNPNYKHLLKEIK